MKGNFLYFRYLIISDKNPNKVLPTLNAYSSIFLVDGLRSVVATEIRILNLGKTDIIIFFVNFSPLIRLFETLLEAMSLASQIFDDQPVRLRVELSANSQAQG